MKMVSIIIPCRNEEKFIGKCLDSIISQDYPKDRLEILVVDGMSTDRSRKIVQEYTKIYPFIRMLNNPKQIASSALNIGIREAKGAIIIRIDAHVKCAEDYIRQCVSLLQTAAADNVGGCQRGIGASYLSKVIAIATTHPFGAGDAKFRFSERQDWVDTVYLGAWYKKTLESLGGFNEDWVVNQDYELNYRLRKAGGKILLSPKIRCRYYVRGSLSSLARQYFRYGIWKVKTLVTYPESVRWRQLVPPAFVLVLVISLALLPLHWAISKIVPSLYVVTNLVASFHADRCHGWRYLPLLPLVFATLHVSWGLGFWAGVLKFGMPRFSWKSLVKALSS